MSLNQMAPSGIHGRPRLTGAARSKLRRLHVRICRRLRPVFEVAAFLGAVLSAVVDLFSGRLPSFGAVAVSCPPDPEPSAVADGPRVP